MQDTTITDGDQLSVTLLDYGARIADINFNGTAVALGYASLEDYLDDPYYMGASIGPITNRISQGRVSIAGQGTFQLPQNEGNNTVHSGGVGFDKQVWQCVGKKENQVQYHLDFDLSKVGMRGLLAVTAEYRVHNGALTISYQSRCDTTTYINLTNHVYLNLDGGRDISEHQFRLFAESYVQVDKQNIPNGELVSINSPMAYVLNGDSQDEFKDSCDHHFNASGASNITQNDSQLLLSACSKQTDIQLEVRGNSPGFQFYTGKFLDTPFIQSGGFCVETQLPPDAINQASFDSPLLHKGQSRLQKTEFKFIKS